jgi:hypothetical protein
MDAEHLGTGTKTTHLREFRASKPHCRFAEQILLSQISRRVKEIYNDKNDLLGISIRGKADKFERDEGENVKNYGLNWKMF